MVRRVRVTRVVRTRRRRRVQPQRVTTVTTTQPRRRKRRQRQRIMTAAISHPVNHPFFKCVYGPPGHPGSENGAPDGSIDKSVVIEHRGTYSIRPDTNGNIVFALVPSPNGTLGISKGTVADSTIYVVDPTNPEGAVTALGGVDYTPGGVNNPFSADSYTHVGLTPSRTVESSQYHIMPHTEYYPPFSPSGAGNNSIFQATQFRVLANVATVTYVGTTLTDSGAMAICRLPFKTVQDLVGTANTGTGATAFQEPANASVVPTLVPDSFGDIAIQPGATTFAIRQGAHLCNPPPDLDYNQIKNDWLPVVLEGEQEYNVPFVMAARHIGNSPQPEVPVPLYGIDGNVTYVAITGMAVGDTSNIIVETRTCVEYTLAYSSPIARFAKVPPLKNQLVLDTVKAHAREMPAASPKTDGRNWLEKAWDWYWPKEVAAARTAWTIGGKVKDLFYPSGQRQQSITNPMTLDRALEGFQRLAITG